MIFILRILICVAGCILICMFFSACSISEPKILPSRTSTTEITGGPQVLSDNVKSRESRITIGTVDLGIGTNRFVFALIDNNSRPIRSPVIEANFLFLESKIPNHMIAQEFSFLKWPTGLTGVYVANIEFHKQGSWGLVVSGVDEIGNSFKANRGFKVKSKSSSVAIGEIAPRSRNKTIQNVDNISKITTAVSPDLDLYRISIEDAISNGYPTVIAFASPAFCQTAMCGPQVGILSNLQNQYEGRANFIHVEVFENPDEISGDVNNGRVSPILGEWGIETEPFTFVLNIQGIVVAKFEGFATEFEIKSALKMVLGE